MIGDRGPLGLKPDKVNKEPRKQMRRAAKGKKSSSDCPMMKSAKDQPCLADWCKCGGSTDTTSMRHIRKFGIGGTGKKPPNYIAFYGCQRAEDIFALGSGEWTWRGLMQAMVLTQMILRSKGHLPD